MIDNMHSNRDDQRVRTGDLSTAVVWAGRLCAHCRSLATLNDFLENELIIVSHFLITILLVEKLTISLASRLDMCATHRTFNKL